MAKLGEASRDGGFEVAKVKAHQDVDSLERYSDEWRHASGNDAADRIAKLAASRLPQPSANERDAQLLLDQRLR
eukprot:7271778-Pyramimonas_sp.AAC.1